VVVDASAALWLCLADRSPSALGAGLAAPSLMWSEATSALHGAVTRGELTSERAAVARKLLEGSPVERADPPGLRDVAWRLADELGWAKTYDAEYLALAEILGTRLVTVDHRLRRGADRTGLVLTPDEL